ncbi:unnamed protein product [Staurois parvus]|uniref:Uncharacterized protein n=1 Tax=Staurois parvus TaxID=386267 RepID=A0ABN9DDB5_9NEOB|nr:unnamed protein product [Staurois parvus]
MKLLGNKHEKLTGSATNKAMVSEPGFTRVGYRTPHVIRIENRTTFLCLHM